MKAQFSLKSVLLAFFLTILLLCVLSFTFHWKTNQLADGYAQFEVARMVVDYLEENEDKWPRNWDALEPYFLRNKLRATDMSLEKLRQRIYIDFSICTADLRSSITKGESLDAQIIHAKFTTGFYGKARADAVIANYIRESQQEKRAFTE